MARSSRRRALVVAVVVATLGVTAVAAWWVRPTLHAGDSAASVCTPSSPEGLSTVAVAVADADVDLEITGVRLVDGENLEVVGWSTAPADDYTGAALGFDDSGPATIAGGESAVVEVGLRLVDRGTRGQVESVVLAYDAGLGTRTQEVRSRMALVPAGGTCRTEAEG